VYARPAAPRCLESVRAKAGYFRDLYIQQGWIFSDLGISSFFYPDIRRDMLAAY
jgi:hypothetical protein